MLFVNSILPSIEVRQEMSSRLDSLNLETATFDEIVDRVVDATFVIPKSIHHFDRKRIREIHMVLFNEATDLEDIRSYMETFMEQEIISILADFFKRLKEAGRFTIDVDPKDIVELVVGIMRLTFLEYVIILAYSEEACYLKFKKSIRLILMGKL